MKREIAVLTALVLSACNTAPGQITPPNRNALYVSPDGSDSNPGSLENPLKTLGKCAAIVTAGQTCFIRAGKYRETIKPTNSGTSGAPITFMPYNNEVVTVSGADAVTNWSAYKANIEQASLELQTGYNDASSSNTELFANQVFANGVMLNEARFPNGTTDLLRPKLSNGGLSLSGQTVTINNAELPAGSLDGAVVWMNEWFVSRTAVVSSSGSGSLTATVSDNGSWQRGAFWYTITGALALLDAPGEWFYDGTQKSLYVWSPSGGSPQNIEVKRRNYAFDLTDRSFITVKNLGIFAATITTGATSQGIVLDGIDGKYVSHFATLPDLPADRIVPGTDGFGLIGSHIHDSGIQLRGQGNKLTNSRVTFSAGNIVLLEGSGHEVSNNVLSDGDYLSSYAALIQITGKDHRILRNTMRDAGRSAINVDWKLTGQTLPNVEIAYNDISRFGTVSTDLGALYVCCYVDLTGSSIHHNWVHDVQAFSPFWGTRGIYLDINTFNSTIHHNVIWDLNGGKDSYALSIGSDRGKGERVYNNTFVVPVGDGGPSVEARNNIFAAQASMAVGQQSNNLFQDTPPQFTNPTNGDFTLQTGSLAIDAGIAIPGITDGFAGTAPDIGAYESGSPIWKAGANPSP